MIVVVDYGMGNLHSVEKALQHVAPKENVKITGDVNDIKRAKRIVLPGQGAMPDCMAAFLKTGIYDVLKETKTPIFGVCIGEQMLFEESEEGPTKGLGLLEGKVVRFQLENKKDFDGTAYKVPQMGWNQVAQKTHPLWKGIPDHSYFYFVHSFYAKPKNEAHVVGQTEYGQTFCSAVAHEHIFATQFHPEKSADLGLKLYENFINWRP